ncbi:putative quinol monooxygenase [Priestia koreensis]|uniref:putative quinol monooxygenase n=1 Tax=Priestia koreensis TaxID=284581 RepID=UPI001F58DA31|nr:putative quinol monooxygenase [Priestia koreensis]MCM3005077.1 antibiotic biosynthesis monooxygenase [Priestia koreensis]UNL83066.1 antibiotic biosynthesis monooxygenase [Priestia koreensis]
MSAITINAILTAKPGKEELLRKELQAVLEPSRAEAGCVQYVLHESMEEQGVFVFYELWRDEEALNAHVEADHYKNYREKTADLVAERQVFRLRQI